MSWKDISKSSYEFTAGKFAEWVPDRPFSLPFTANKIQYNEGDEITDANNPVFNIEFTGQANMPTHFPCGYWHKNYVPLVYVVYTSKPYPQYIDDSINISANIISGTLNEILSSFQYTESINISTSILSGILDTILESYSIDSESLNVSTTIISGRLENILLSYSIDFEEISLSASIISGTLNTILISYEDWLPEGLDVSASIISGDHSNV